MIIGVYAFCVIGDIGGCLVEHQEFYTYTECRKWTAYYEEHYLEELGYKDEEFDSFCNYIDTANR